MRKYVVPCVALAGIALLSPRADAASVMLKSRAIPAGKTGSVPVSLVGVGGSGQLWGVDMGLAISNTAVTPTDAANAFVPAVAPGTTDVVVTGTTFVGGGTQPNLYVGYLKGTSAMATTANTSGTPSASIGMLKLSVAAGTAAKTVVNLSVPVTYNVKNDGTGNDVGRAGATGVTVTTAGVLESEAIALLDYIPASVAPAAGKPDLRAPLHKIVVGIPGDITGDGAINSGDLGNLAAALAGKTLSASLWNEARQIAADVAPLNGYVPVSNLAGTGNNGGSYGDSVINSADLGLLAAKLAGKATAANYPVAE